MFYDNNVIFHITAQPPRSVLTTMSVVRGEFAPLARARVSRRNNPAWWRNNHETFSDRIRSFSPDHRRAALDSATTVPSTDRALLRRPSGAASYDASFAPWAHASTIIRGSVLKGAGL